MKEHRDKEAWGRLEAYSPEFAKAACDRFKDRQDRLKSSHLHDRIQRAWQMLYSRDKDGNCDTTILQRRGNQGEVLYLQSNRFARILKDQQADIRQTPPNSVPQALNSSAKAQDQTKLAKGLLRWYRRYLHLEDMRVQRVEIMQIASEACQHIRWDPLRGKEIAVGNAPDGQPGKPVYEGDFVSSVLSPYDYAMDPTSPDPRRARWGIAREPMDRWDAIATYVEAEEAAGGDSKTIEALRKAIMDAPTWSQRMVDWKYEADELKFDDSIAVLHVYIERCAAVPEGRHAIVLNEKHVLLDGPMDEERAGLFVQRARDVIFRTSEAHSDAYDGLPLAEAHAGTLTTMISNFDAFGMQRIAVARESNVDETEFRHGLSFVYYDAITPGDEKVLPPPTPLIPTTVPAEGFDLEQLLAHELDTVMGGSPVRRGDPDSTKGDSGSKTALLYAAAQTSSSPLVTSTLSVDEEIDAFLISSLRRHVKMPRLATIVGDKNEAIAKEYIGTDLDEIAQVITEPADPARDSFQGRMAAVEIVKDAKTQQERDMLLALMRTGQAESVTDPEEAERMLIERENAALADENGEPVIVDPYDKHMQHIVYHKAEKADPEIRRNPARMKRIDEHMMGHIEALTPGAPRFAGMDILAVTGQQPLPPAAPSPQEQAMQAQGMAPKPHEGPGGPGGPGGPPEKKPSNGPMPNMPSQPKNAATGEEMDLPVPEAPKV